MKIDVNVLGVGFGVGPSVEKRGDVRNVEDPPREVETSACGVSGGSEYDLV